LNVVAVAKDERAGTNTKHVWIYTSTDGGVNWTNQQFPLRTPVAPYSSDPVASFSDDGVCYVTALPYVPSGASTESSWQSAVGSRPTHGLLPVLGLRPIQACCLPPPGVGSPAVGVQIARSFDGGITFEPASEVTNNPTA